MPVRTDRSRWPAGEKDSSGYLDPPYPEIWQNDDPRRFHSFLVNNADRIIAVSLRCIFFVAVIFSLNRLVTLGTAPSFLSAAVVAGILAASLLATSKLTSLGFILASIALWLLYEALFLAAELLPIKILAGTFSLYLLRMHLDLVMLCFFSAAVSTWFFWRSKHGLTIELLACSVAAIYLLSGHRNFHFESPQALNSLAWILGVNHLWMLILIGILYVVCLLLYVFCSALACGPLRLRRIRHYPAAPRVFAASVMILLFGSFLFFLSQGIYRHFSQAAMTRTANGVGQNNNEKMTPLGFHSALGGSNQPTALVRLEGDYTSNPFVPMLYFREAALSEFDGRQLVIAGPPFDVDVNNSSPYQAYSKPEDSDLIDRNPLTQSIYLLSEHKTAFAVDYPLAINPLVNPQPGRFKAAYRAHSIAPAFSLESLKDEDVGDPRWSNEEKRLYLTVHPDQRYAALAREITQGVQASTAKALAVTTYLSKFAIYTLAPGHEVGKDDDPVAPFIFGDRRGYCVHFAHATVYLLRALGIPARIGTGYLTDLSQSKDGHILLRMSDRHAWAEVFVRHKGWIPFDIKPEQVESHAETPVDMKLLEELMGLIGPGEEMLPQDITQGEPNVDAESRWRVPDWRYPLLPIVVFMAFLVAGKFYFLCAWALPGRPHVRLKRLYLSLVCRLYDLGCRRLAGETKQEFQARIKANLGIDLLASTAALNRSIYAVDGSNQITSSEVSGHKADSFAAWRQIHPFRRIWAALNPASMLSLVTGGKW